LVVHSRAVSVINVKQQKTKSDMAARLSGAVTLRPNAWIQYTDTNAFSF